MTEHAPTTEEVYTWGCVYGDCDHLGDCPPVTMQVCDTCRGEPYDGDIETLIPWPCAHAPTSADSGEAGQ